MKKRDRESYRSGHNEPHSKCGRPFWARGFESHTLRFSKSERHSWRGISVSVFHFHIFFKDRTLFYHSVRVSCFQHQIRSAKKSFFFILAGIAKIPALPLKFSARANALAVLMHRAAPCSITGAHKKFFRLTQKNPQFTFSYSTLPAPNVRMFMGYTFSLPTYCAM